MLLVQQNPHNKDQNPKVLQSYQTKYARTGCDVNSRWLVEWEGLCQGHLTTDLNNAGLKEHTASVQCEEGDLVVECESPPVSPLVLRHALLIYCAYTECLVIRRRRWQKQILTSDPPYRPETFHIVPRPDRFPGKIKEKQTFHIPVHKGVHGLCYEADETARCIAKGVLECPLSNWQESRIVQGWFDQVGKKGQA